MAKTSKVMLWSLGDSISFSRVSWKAKIAWPCLLSGTDEQGRFVAEPDIFKGIICRLVKEIEEEDVPSILSEFEGQRMIVTYESNGLLLGQVINRWKYNSPAWAARSKYPPPEGWVDRVHEKVKGEQIFLNWDEPGGFSIEQNSIEQYRDEISISSASDTQEINHSNNISWTRFMEAMINVHGDRDAIKGWFYHGRIAEVTEHYVLIQIPSANDAEFINDRMMHRVQQAVDSLWDGNRKARLEAMP